MAGWEWLQNEHEQQQWEELIKTSPPSSLDDVSECILERYYNEINSSVLCTYYLTLNKQRELKIPEHRIASILGFILNDLSIFSMLDISKQEFKSFIDDEAKNSDLSRHAYLDKKLRECFDFLLYKMQGVKLTAVSDLI